MKKALISASLFTLLIAPALASAQVLQGGGSQITGVLDRVTNWIFGILMLGAVIVILIAAFTFLTAAGDAEKVKTARNYIVYALVAIVVAFVSKALVTWFYSIIQ